MAAGDIYQLTVVQVLGTRSLANVFYQETVDDAGSSNPEADAVDAFELNVIANLRAVQAPQLTYECIVSRRVVPQTQPRFVKFITAAGTGGGNALPSNQSCVVSHQSLPKARGNIGRVFIAGVPEAWIEKGTIRQDQFSNFDNFMGDLETPYTVSGRTYKVVHHSPSLNTYEDIVQTILRPIPRKLRGRTERICSIG